MKAIVNAPTLAKVLKRVSPVIKKNTVLPILSCVMLQFDKNKLTVKATDLETSVLSTIDCECTKPFDAILEYASLADICSKITEPITIDASGDKILITSSDSKFKFSKVGESEIFPKIEEEDFLFDIEVDSDFFWSLSCANSCKSPEDLKVTMNAACVHIKKDAVTIVGTDAFVLYKNTMKIKTGKEAQLMVPEQFVLMVKPFPEGKISISEHFIKAEFPDMLIISRLFDAKFCSYQSIIPDEINYNFKTNRGSLINSLGKTGVVANLSTHMCAINFNGGDIKIVTQDIDYGREAETVLEATHEVGFKAIGVNGNQMLKLLNLFDSEEVEMAFTSETKTIFLRPVGEPNVMCLLQPLMLDGQN